MRTRQRRCRAAALRSGTPIDVKSWFEPTEPLRIVGPIHYVGTRELGAYLITTPAGHILLDGEWQRMTAGSGISHSEFNASKTEPVHFLQIWILPESNGLAPGYEQKEFPAAGKQGQLRLVASRDGGESSLKIHQDVKAYNPLLTAGESVSYELAEGRHAWLQMIKGEIKLNGTALKAGDGAVVSDESRVTLSAVSDAEVVLFDLALEGYDLRRWRSNEGLDTGQGTSIRGSGR